MFDNKLTSWPNKHHEGVGIAQVLINMSQAEAATVQSSPALEQLLTDPAASAESMSRTVREFALSQGVHQESPASIAEILELAKTQIDILFPEEDERKAVATIVQQYLYLVQAARNDTSDFGISPHISAGTIWRLIEENIWVMAYQNHHSNSIFMGDHGIQHIVHDINTMRELIRQQRQLGLDIPYGAELAGMQALIIHDEMYPHLQQTPQGKANPLLEKGHPLQAARIVLERSDDPQDVYAMVFPSAALGLIHQAVLTHDSTDFTLQGEYSAEERVVRSIRAADATAVYWGKLTLLLRHPTMRFKALEALRLLQTAGEIGGDAEQEIMQAVRTQLRSQVHSLTGLPEATKQQMLSGVETIAPLDNKFELRRMGATVPEFYLSDNQTLIITIEESRPNLLLAKIFGQEIYHSLVKAVAEWIGEDDRDSINLKRELHVVGKGKSKGIEVYVKKRLHSHPGVDTDPDLQPRARIHHHEALEKALRDKGEFLHYAKADNNLAAQQRKAEGSPADAESIKQQRLQLLRAYLETSFGI